MQVAITGLLRTAGIRSGKVLSILQPYPEGNPPHRNLVPDVTPLTGKAGGGFWPGPGFSLGREETHYARDATEGTILVRTESTVPVSRNGDAANATGPMEEWETVSSERKAPPFASAAILPWWQKEEGTWCKVCPEILPEEYLFPNARPATQCTGRKSPGIWQV